MRVAEASYILARNLLSLSHRPDEISSRLLDNVSRPAIFFCRKPSAFSVTRLKRAVTSYLYAARPPLLPKVPRTTSLSCAVLGKCRLFSSLNQFGR